MMVDDPIVVRESLRLLLLDQIDLVVVGEANNGSEALNLPLLCPRKSSST
jgi:DNA-binding NarL/FixJ family response regulator